MYFRATNELVAGGKPVFLGVVKQGFLDPATREFTDALPITQEDVKAIRYSVFKLGANPNAVASMSLVMNPVPEFQNVPIDTKAIVPFDFVKDWVYDTMKVPKFEVNFVFVPENVPPIFATSGNYEVRFEIIDENNEIYPAVVEMQVK